MSYGNYLAIGVLAGAVGMSEALGCAPAMTEQEANVSGQGVEGNEQNVMGAEGCIYGSPPSWVANPGDGYIVAESACEQPFRLCQVAEQLLHTSAIARLLAKKCAAATSTSTDGNQNTYHENVSGHIMGIHGSYLGFCQLPNGGKGYITYLKLVAPGVTCDNPPK